MAPIMTGKAEKIDTRVSFQPNANEIAMQPNILNREIRGNAMVGPRSSWSLVGSEDILEVKEPAEFPSWSKKDIGFLIIFSKYSCLYIVDIYYLQFSVGSKKCVYRRELGDTYGRQTNACPTKKHIAAR